MRVVVFGLPGCGKTIFSEILAMQTESAFISRKGSADSFSKASEERVKILYNEMKKNSATDKFIIDGFITTVEEAKALDKLIDIQMAIFLSIPVPRAITRLIGRRMDPETKVIYHVFETKLDEEVKKRLVIMDGDKNADFVSRVNSKINDINQLKDYYSSKGVLVEINSLGDFRKNINDVVSQLKSKGLL